MKEPIDQTVCSKSLGVWKGGVRGLVFENKAMAICRATCGGKRRGQGDELYIIARVYEKQG